jgi:hypothetical protein
VGERNDASDDFYLCIQWPTTLYLIHAPEINFWSTFFWDITPTVIRLPKVLAFLTKSYALHWYFPISPFISAIFLCTARAPYL